MVACHSLATKLEEAGLVVKRAASKTRAMELARELQQTGQLRCIVFGGGEPPKQPAVQSGGGLFGGGAGIFGAGNHVAPQTTEVAAPKKPDSMSFLDILLDEQYVPLERVAILVANRSLKEASRLRAWKGGIKVLPQWPNELA